MLVGLPHIDRTNRGFEASCRATPRQSEQLPEEALLSRPRQGHVEANDLIDREGGKLSPSTDMSLSRLTTHKYSRYSVSASGVSTANSRPGSPMQLSRYIELR